MVASRTCGGHVANKARKNRKLTARGAATQQTKGYLYLRQSHLRWARLRRAHRTPAVGMSRTRHGKIVSLPPAAQLHSKQRATSIFCGRHACGGHVANGPRKKLVSLLPAAKPYRKQRAISIPCGGHVANGPRKKLVSLLPAPEFCCKNTVGFVPILSGAFPFFPRWATKNHNSHRPRRNHAADGISLLFCGGVLENKA